MAVVPGGMVPIPPGQRRRPVHAPSPGLAAGVSRRPTSGRYAYPRIRGCGVAYATTQRRSLVLVGGGVTELNGRAAVRVSTGSGELVDVPPGGRLVFGRGPDVDLVVVAGRGLSRRAGVIAGMPGGVLGRLRDARVGRFGGPTV